MVIAQTSRTVTVSPGETATAVFSGVSVQVCRSTQVILFDLSRSFIHPEQKPALEQVFFFGLTSSSSGTQIEPKPDEFLLIVGHSDQLGQRTQNQALSKRRARAAWAVFIVDAEIWETLYQTEHWGALELGIMSAQVDVGGDSTLIEGYRTNRQARVDLMERYLLFLRPIWVPLRSPVIKPNTVTSPNPPILGCGEDLPLINAPDAERAENRRVEFYYFQTPDPGIRHEDDCPSQAIYRSWQATCSLELITVQIELQDEYGEPFVGAFDLTLPNGGLLHERTDSAGIWIGNNLPAGLYTVTVAGNSLSLIP